MSYKLVCNVAQGLTIVRPLANQDRRKNLPAKSGYGEVIMQRVQALSLHIQSGKPPPGYSKRHPRLSYGFTDLSEPLQRIRALSIHIIQCWVFRDFLTLYSGVIGYSVNNIVRYSRHFPNPIIGRAKRFNIHLYQLPGASQ